MIGNREALLQLLDSSFTVTVCVSVIASGEALVDVSLILEVLADLAGKFRHMVAGDMLRSFMKRPNVINVWLRNNCCCASRLCGKSVLCVCEPVCNDPNCVEAF